MTGGCNGYQFAIGSSDALDPPPERSLSCCARITRGGKTGWCWLADGHWPATEHDGFLSTPPMPGGFGPRRKR